MFLPLLAEFVRIGIPRRVGFVNPAFLVQQYDPGRTRIQHAANGLLAMTDRLLGPARRSEISRTKATKRGCAGVLVDILEGNFHRHVGPVAMADARVWKV